MELNERETLIKVEQQLNNLIDNQAQISNELREFLKKLEKNDKTVGLLHIELKTHLGEAKLLKEYASNKHAYVTKEIDEFKKELKVFGEKYDKKTEDLEDVISTEKTERSNFEIVIKTSVKNFKIFISVLVGLFSFLLVLLKLAPYIVKFFN